MCSFIWGLNTHRLPGRGEMFAARAQPFSGIQTLAELSNEKILLTLMPAEKPIVLILCTGNSCRSHIAEGILRAAAGDILDVCKAQ